MQKKITLITGGQRSGKSSFAERYALSLSPKPYYIATSRIWDDDHLKRIQRHQADRGDEWQNFEKDKILSELEINHQTVVIDCVTLWATNFFFDHTDETTDEIFQRIQQEYRSFTESQAHFIFVTNEIGLGGMSIDPLQRKFTDLLGWINQMIAKDADEVTLMVSGLPVNIKG